MFEKIRLVVLFYPVFLFSLSFHESAHALVAHRFGDPTAKFLGRITLNPLPHMELFGTFLFPILFLLTGARVPLGGWGKPVPVNPLNLKNPRQDNLWIALAGPLSNFILAFIFAFLLWVLYGVVFSYFKFSKGSILLESLLIVYQLLEVGIWVNLGLAFFNLLPIHPLDGGKVIEGLLPQVWVDTYNKVASMGIFILFLLYYLGFYEILFYPVKWLARVLIPM